jgi:signal transduction histidine kinase/ActR/RegA family two-component response regulator
MNSSSVTIDKAVQRAEDALRDREERYRTLFDAMDEGYCIIEVLFDAQKQPVDYRFIEVNGSFERQAGMHDVIGKRMLEFVPAIESHWLQNYGKVAVTGEGIRFSGEYKGLNRYFDVYAFRANGWPERHVAVLFADVTQRTLAEQALREADRRKDEFLAMLAHELRNPLAAIRNAVQILLQKEGDAQTVRSAAAILERQVGHMVRQVDDLLDVSRISRDKIELRKERVELAPIVNDALETVRPLCESLRHEIQVTLPANPLFITGDRIRLAQIVGNLLNNACKFTDKGGRIWLTVEEMDDQAVIRVRDTGIGLAADQLGPIFELFAQVDHSLERARDGLGLGLTLVKKLVEMHNGTVEARSAGPGRGSEFVVRLPLLRGLPSAPPRPSSVVKQMKTVPCRILIADDNRDSASSLAMLLKLLGHTVDTAYDGLEAVERAETFRGDVILLDIGMPRLNGYEAARRIRERHPSGLKLVALTGWGQEEDRRRSEDAGFDAHLVKPIDLAALANLLAEWAPDNKFLEVSAPRNPGERL